MPHSLRAKLSGLRYKKIISDKDYNRLCKALDNEGVLDKISTEIKGKYRVVLKGTPKDDWAVKWNDCVDEVLQIIDKYRKEQEDADSD
jgi:hypothetical protein